MSKIEITQSVWEELDTKGLTLATISPEWFKKCSITLPDGAEIKITSMRNHREQALRILAARRWWVNTHNMGHASWASGVQVVVVEDSAIEGSIAADLERYFIEAIEQVYSERPVEDLELMEIKDLCKTIDRLNISYYLRTGKKSFPLLNDVALSETERQMKYQIWAGEISLFEYCVTWDFKVYRLVMTWLADRFCIPVSEVYGVGHPKVKALRQSQSA